MTAAWSHSVYTCILLFVQMKVVPSGIWKLLPRMNQTCGGLQFFFWGLGWFILIFLSCQAKSHWVWRLALKYIHRYTSNWLKWCHLAYKLLKPWHNFLEFSKLFKCTVNLVYVNFWNCDTVNYKLNNLSVNNCWKNYLCHAQSRCLNRLTKTIVC